MDFRGLFNKEKVLVKKHYTNIKKILDLHKLIAKHKKTIELKKQNLQQIEKHHENPKIVKNLVHKQRRLIEIIKADLKKISIVPFIETEEKKILAEIKKLIHQFTAFLKSKHPKERIKHKNLFHQFLKRQENNMHDILRALSLSSELKSFWQSEQKFVADKEKRIRLFFKHLNSPIKIKQLVRKEKQFIIAAEKRFGNFIGKIGRTTKHTKPIKSKKKLKLPKLKLPAFKIKLPSLKFITDLFKSKKGKHKNIKSKKAKAHIPSVERERFKFKHFWLYFTEGIKKTLNQISKVFETDKHKHMIQNMDERNKIKREVIKEIEKIERNRNLLDYQDHFFEIYHGALENLLNIKYEFTEEELESELHKLNINERVKKLIRHMALITEERFERDLTRDELHSLMNQVKIMIAQL